MRDRVRRQAEKSTVKGSMFFDAPGAPIFKPEPKNSKNVVYRLDIIPYILSKPFQDIPAGEMWYTFDYYSHTVAMENGTFVSAVCPLKTAGLKCPVCEEARRREKNPKYDYKEDIKPLLPKHRQLFNVINSRDPNSQIQIWDTSYFAFGQNLESRLSTLDSDEEDYLLFFLPSNGYNLRLQFSLSSLGGGKDFLSVSNIEFKERAEQYDDDIIKEAYQLDKIVRILPYGQLKNMFFPDDVFSDDEDDDEEEYEEKRTVKSSKRKPAPVVDDDEDEDEEDEKPQKAKKAKVVEPEDDDDDEEEEKEEVKKPARRGRPPKAAKPVVEDEDNDEDEEEEKPEKSSKVPRCPAKSEDDDEDDEDDEIDYGKKAKENAKAHARKAVKEEVEDDEEDEDEDDAPKTSRRRGAAKPKSEPEEDNDEDEEEEKPKKSSAKGKCPNGYRWGVDWDNQDTEDVCEKCDLWMECYKASK